jgi:CelD/BcsL family acetyltransferase involved in cellulose biosynthesis
MQQNVPQSNLRVRVISDPREFAQMKTEWNDLLRRSAADELVLTWDWLATWWDVFKAGRELWLLAIYDRERLVGLAPLLRRTLFFSPLGPYRRLEFLGTGEPEADEIALVYLHFILEAGREWPVLGQMLHALMTIYRTEWDELLLTRMSAEHPCTPLFQEWFQATDCRVEQQEVNTTFYATLPDRYEDYLASLSSNTRYQIRRGFRALEEAGPWTLERVETPEDLVAAKEQLIALHQARWEGKGQPGVFASQRFRTFHERMLPRLLNAGQLSLASLRLGEEVLGVLYNICYQGRVYHYLPGVKILDDPHLRPGILLHALCIRDAIEQGRREYDFLQGDAQYKRSLSHGRRALVEWRVSRRDLKESLASGVRFVGHGLNRVGRRLYQVLPGGSNGR